MHATVHVAFVLSCPTALGLSHLQMEKFTGRYQVSRISFYLARVVFSCVTHQGVVEAAGCDGQPG